jgi:protein-export membrane protein SecD
MRRNTLRTVAIVVFLLVTFFYLSPLVLPKTYDKTTNTEKIKKPFTFWTEKLLKLGLDLRGGMEINLYVDLSEIHTETERKDAVKAAVEVIQNRIDQFGVAEPSIQTVGEDKIVVQLPGLRDFSRAKDLIGKTALLEFKLVATADETQRVIEQLDLWLSQNYQNYPFLNVLNDADFKDDEILKTDTEEETDKIEWHQEIMSYLVNSGVQSMTVSHENKTLLRQLLKDEAFKNALVERGFQILPNKENLINPKADLELYVLYPTASLTGSYLTNAETRMGGQGDFMNANKPYVSLKFNREGSRMFERVTAQNLKRRLAIVLDDVVYVAPVIQDRIRGGEAQITGSFTLEECNDLVIVLKAGNLPAPVEIGEERIVGPSLGSDSIKQGAKAVVIAVVLVMIFMVIYYKLSGIISVIALFLKIGFIFAALTYFEATLTLPGIAGIILTIGMAVDANVLIFERIKEELKVGKTVRNSIDAGFSRAIITIVDANITTLITAAVLYQFGSGSVRGFAVTLTIGILASMFTAILVSRAIFDTFVSNKNRDTLSI